jgi:hypothetical protein
LKNNYISVIATGDIGQQMGADLGSCFSEEKWRYISLKFGRWFNTFFVTS